ncbi:MULTISPECIES: reverse transcriptase domain-containing protein [unclassified Rhizobium]|uniref:reverse transcriptase domain-containing protein n=1 Tax=unclassified Rhizobium TaxID=2613769 RepID=UPI000EA87950|nr:MULTISPECIES: reverse transcriptase domain-containing protein [unclassified Rhizobium]AYG67444.1 RNA-directed DNA polymerase (reverse transcriptase) protein [Rhizobium sp. CCGE531]AYG73838.1 RNA-directed DNA polymerase (reverse transcriptase) protein [Rhizobium sp. CCGE532]
MKAKDVFEQEFAFERLMAIFEDRISETSTVGKDGVHPSVFAESLDSEIGRIAEKVRNDTYHFTAFKQKLILKGPRKPPREISIATVRDRLTLRALTNALMSIFGDARVPPAHYIVEEISDFIRPLNDDYSFIQIDIKDFYPSVVHDELMYRLRTRIRYKPFLNLILKAVQTPTGDVDQGDRNPIGIPQGLSVSNILSSIYMIRFDAAAQSRFTYFRYVDDIIIVCRALEAKRNFRLISRRLERIGLHCHQLTDNSKTKIVPLSKGVDYLGYHLTPSLISVRKSSYRRMIENIMNVITSAKYNANQAKILMRLNLKITGCIFNGKRMGWMFFFSMTEDIKQLQRLDVFVSRAWRRLGMEQYGHPKRFVKAYHEIKFNFTDSRYIPHFDDYTMDQKMELISVMLVRDLAEIATWAPDRINRQFLRLIRKEVAELEKDITPLS